MGTVSQGASQSIMSQPLSFGTGMGSGGAGKMSGGGGYAPPNMYYTPSYGSATGAGKASGGSPYQFQQTALGLMPSYVPGYAMPNTTWRPSYGMVPGSSAGQGPAPGAAVNPNAPPPPPPPAPEPEPAPVTPGWQSNGTWVAPGDQAGINPWGWGPGSHAGNDGSSAPGYARGGAVVDALRLTSPLRSGRPQKALTRSKKK